MAKKRNKSFHMAGKAYVKKAIALVKKHTKDKQKQKKMIKQLKAIEKCVHNLKKMAGGR